MISFPVSSGSLRPYVKTVKKLYKFKEIKKLETYLLVLDVDRIELDLLFDDCHFEFIFEKNSRDFFHLTDDVIGVPPSLGTVDQNKT